MNRFLKLRNSIVWNIAAVVYCSRRTRLEQKGAIMESPTFNFLCWKLLSHCQVSLGT
jgi:hypothetical protein